MSIISAVVWVMLLVLALLIVMVGLVGVLLLLSLSILVVGRVIIARSSAEIILWRARLSPVRSRYPVPTIAIATAIVAVRRRSCCWLSRLQKQYPIRESLQHTGDSLRLGICLISSLTTACYCRLLKLFP